MVPDMRQAGWGRVINVATGMATTPQAVMADYAAAKAAMVNSTVSLAKALAGTGVTANTVSPGVIHDVTKIREQLPQELEALSCKIDGHVRS
jgi:3-oxoacyl-[acyl-carrier protein] reductase